jgi:anti-sigma factor RsiW
MSCEVLDQDLEAFVDRELDDEGVRRVREHVAECEGCRVRVAERQMLGRLIRSVPYHAAPERLRGRVASQTSRSVMTRRLFTWAAAAAVIIAIAGGTALLRSPRPDGGTIVAEVVNGHVRSLMANHLFDVQSTDQHTVKPWFLGKLDFSPPVVDLATSGFPLIGGRLDYIAGRPAAALVYQRHQHTINMFVSDDGHGASSTIDRRSLRGFHVRHWTRDGLSFWVVSDLNESELDEFVSALIR